MRQPHIVHLTKYYPPYYGGIPGYVQLLAEEQSNFFRVTVLTSNTRWKRSDEIHAKLRVIRVPRLMELRSTALCPTMPRELRLLEPDLVHIHFPDPMAHLSYGLLGKKVKVVLSWHSDIVRQRWLARPYSPFIARMLAHTDRVIVGSPALRENSIWLKRMDDRCVTIPYGVDLANFDCGNKTMARVQDLRERYGSRIVLFIGRLIYYKGLSYLLEAMARVDGRLLIVGVGPLEKDCRRQVAQLGIEDRVVFLGGIPPEELTAYLHACSILVLPSIAQSETFGIVQLEAMACRKPVVSTNLPTGVPWVNQDGKTGIVVPPRDATALAIAIQRLLDDPDLRQRFGEAGHRRVESEFTNRLHFQRVQRLYEQVLGQTIGGSKGGQ